MNFPMPKCNRLHGISKIYSNKGGSSRGQVKEFSPAVAAPGPWLKAAVDRLCRLVQRPRLPPNSTFDSELAKVRMIMRSAPCAAASGRKECSKVIIEHARP
jgi:hypothetical protein